MHKRGWGSWTPDSGWGEGRETWNKFGYRLFFRFATFMLFIVTGLVALGALMAVLVSSVELGAALGAVLLVALLFLIIGTLVGRSIRRTWLPVRDLIGAAGALADGDYSARAASPSSPAMGSVVRSFNEMATRLEEADAQRRQLLADVGHELRTPLTVVRGEIEAMIDGVHEPAEHLDLLLDEVVVMERLLEDLRTLSLAEAGALDLHPEPTDLASLLADIADSYRRTAGDAGVEIETRLDSNLDDVRVDPVRIREVVTNLVVNALDAMPEGGTLSLLTEKRPDSAVIEVRDTGIGIDADALPPVFDRFQKGEGSSGSGLGLTISRDLVEAHGGTIDISSEPQVGTVVRVVLPTG
ncbi:MAG: sensor histidine kinase [Acidimicrobiia bacterium]